MALKYALLENLLTARPDDYTAQAQAVKSHDMNSIVERMLQKGSTITKTDVLAALNLFFEVVENITAEGETVNTDLFTTNFSIQGVFEGASDSFDHKRHHLKLNVNAGVGLKKTATTVKLEKTKAPEVLPHVIEVKDSITGSVSEHISSEGVIEIIGSMIKIAGDDPKNGVYLVNAEG
ncbi:MAG: DNA-binding domain-containing protein, partial [Bacteroidales bacterium]